MTKLNNNLNIMLSIFFIVNFNNNKKTLENYKNRKEIIV
jgi:hypothetical protein